MAIPSWDSLEKCGIKPYYKDESVFIVNDDCRKILPLLHDESVNLIITDPPYGINYRSPWGNKLKDYIAGDSTHELKELIAVTIPQMIRVLPENSEIYWFSAGGGGEPVIAIAWFEFKNFEPELKVKNLLVWDKEFIGTGWDWRFQYETIFQLVKGSGFKSDSRNRSNVLRGKKIIPQFGEHPTPKSTEIIAQLINPKSRQGDLILDPFMGGGSTLLTAKLLGRRAIGIEIEEKYCKMAVMKCSQTVMGLNSVI